MYFQSNLAPPQSMPANALWLLFGEVENQDSKGQPVVLQQTQTGQLCIPSQSLLQACTVLPNVGLFLGYHENQPCYTARSRLKDLPAPLTFCPLRSLLGVMPESVLNLIGRARQYLYWDRTHQYCSQCGQPVERLVDERAKVCRLCELHFYPRLSPCVIVLIERGDQVLLARSRHYPKGLYSLLAGFIEPGEAVEEAVAREVYEEVRLQIKNIRYVASQPWPFPHSLMLGFNAEYASGHILMDERELEVAAWFHWRDIPKVPPQGTLARLLIDAYLNLRQVE